MGVHGIDREELGRFNRFIDESRILWGIDAEHKTRWLGAHEKVSPSGTFRHAFEELLSSLTSDGVWLDYAVSMSESEDLGRLIELFEDLVYDLDPIILHERKSVGSWISYLVKLGQKHIGLELPELLQALRFDLHQEVSFDFFEKLLPEIFRGITCFRSSKEQPQVVFNSIQSDLLHSANVICFLGMNEGRFPRHSFVSPLDHHPKLPHQFERDRYIFLEALCHAKRRFFVSFLSNDERDGKPLLPSLPVQELLHFTEEFFKAGCKIQYHPLHAFDPAYFAQEALKNNSIKDFLIANTPLRIKRGKELPLKKPTLDIEIPKVIFIEKLIKFFKDPIKYYLQEKMGLYFSEDPLMEIERSELVLTPLETYKVRRDFSREGHVGSERLSNLRGGIPPGLLGALGKEKIGKACSEVEQAFSEFGLDQNSFFDLSFKGDELKYEETAFHGALNDLSREGIVFFDGKLKKNRLAAQAISNLLNISNLHEKVNYKRSIFIRENKDLELQPSENSLRTLIRLYMLGQHAIVPLHEKLLDAFIKDDVDLYKKSMRALIKSAENSPDKYLQFFAKHAETADCPSIFESWKEEILPLFSCEVMG